MNKFISKARFITLGLAVAFLPFSIRYCHLSLLLFTIVCLAEGDFINKGRQLAQNPLAWILPAFFLLHVVGVFYSDNVANAWTNVDKKIAFVLAPLIIVSTAPFSKIEMKRLLWIFVAACFVGTVVCLVNAAVMSRTDVPLWNFGPQQPYLALHPEASGRWPYFTYIGLASGIDLHPTYFAFYLLVCVLIVLRTITTRWLSLTMVAWFLVLIMLLSSRVVVAATAITLLFVAIMNSRERVLMAGIAIMIGVIFINPVVLYRNAQQYTTSNFTWPPAAMSDNPISIRTSLIWLSLHVVRDINPLVGTGVGDVEDSLTVVADKYNVHNTLSTSDPHNQYLHTYIALGVLGLLMLLVVFITPLWMFFRQREFLACAGVLVFMAVCLTESALELQKGIVLFALAVSLAGNQLREWRFTTQQLKYA